jgi:hypothetical protein
MLKQSPFAIFAACSLCATIAVAQEVPVESPQAPASAVEKKADEKKPAERSTTDKPATTASSVDKPTSTARTTPAPKPTPKPAMTLAQAPVAELVATPKPKKPGFFQRLFRGRKKTPAATPSPEASPTPTTSRAGRRTAPSTTPAPDAETKPDRTVKPSSTPKLDMPKVEPARTVKAPPADSTEDAPPSTPPKTAASATAKKSAATKPPVIEAKSETKKPAIEPSADADPDVKERYRFDVAKAKASEDPQVKSLKAKADNASTDAESRKALRTYNQALFDKIRKVDKSVSERADLLEAAILKRLSD